MQLHESGIDAKNIVWLVADQYNITQNTAHLPVQPTRVKDYKFEAHHQFFVGTPAILARLSMCRDHLIMPAPLVVIVRTETHLWRMKVNAYFIFFLD
jgi:hypothetical protein